MLAEFEIPVTTPVPTEPAGPTNPTDPVERAFEEDSITANSPTEWTPPAKPPSKNVPYPLRPA